MKKTKNLIEKSENKEDIVLTIPALLELQKQIEEISRNINNQVVNNLFFNIEDVMKMTGWSRKTVEELFRHPEFSSTDLGRKQLVLKTAFINFFSVKRKGSERNTWINNQ